MFAHAAILCKLLEDRGEDPDLIVQVLNDSRFVQPSSIEKYCRLLKQRQPTYRNLDTRLSTNFTSCSQSGILYGLTERPLIVVLTRNSSQWIGKQASFFTSNSFDSIFYVDSRSHDKTEEVLARLGVRYVLHDSIGNTPETGMRKVISDNPDRWILRLDDDEIISPLAYHDLCLRLKSGVITSEHTYSLPRKWLFIDPESRRICISRYQVFLDHDYQTRLFYSGSVEHDSRLHTPGFTLSSGVAPVRLQRYCEILHFDSVIHSLSDRLLKLMRYDRISPGNFTRYKSFYIPETIPIDYHCAIPFEYYACDPEVLAYGLTHCSADSD